MNAAADSIKDAVSALEAGGVVAYPTEAVFGLGCDPLREEAIDKLFALKGRPRNKGLIVIAGNLHQLLDLIDIGNSEALARASATWPGPATWVFPARSHVPDWLTGGRDTLAVRVTAHPTAAALCAAFGRGLVSTSANPAGEAPARDSFQVRELFGDQLGAIVEGQVGGLENPTAIRDAISGEVLRNG